ncbi:hypothetical protein EYS42_08625 [Aquabacterium lacunae]|uniref:Tetratricopeptide repeat protein n=1 Tax=Aquabacterium lacunae TaxID=2528630 RepID=A0A4Q9GYK8_9BURK|nr:hypothetical protein [Aquabacterium lacunae]TBO31301.1 hypothetical protein EYS42_08625 [Aquabacterium lacunae]
MTMPLNATERTQQAEAAWQQGRQCEDRGDVEGAHAHYRLAHDLVVDCPRLHQRAHEHLRRVNRQRHAWREWLTDQALLKLAPLAAFEIVAFLMTRQVLGGRVCARSRGASQA